MRDRATSPQFVQVALPLPLFQTFTYAVEAGLSNPVTVGSRVIVPLRNDREVGICVGVSDASPLQRKPKAVVESPDVEPAIGAALLELCKWMADYYVVPLGVVLRAVLPAALTGAETPHPSRKTRRVVRLGAEIPSLLERDKTFGRSKQQRAVFELVESLGGRTTVEHLTSQLDFSPSVLKSLEKRGLIAIEEEEVERDPFSTRGGISTTRLKPTPAQQEAVDTMASAEAGSVFLLHGITGSGKTLVYIELLRKIVEERGKTAIVLVPEIALTPQTVDRFRAAFGDQIAVLHSALSEGERYDAWLALKRGDKRIVVGARSAVFAPLENLGAIIVDEEHESSYKQGETPRYHAREVAIVRARNEGAITVLGSATPSLESWSNAEAGKYTLLTLPDRVGGGRLPSVEVVDLRRAAVDYTAMAHGGVEYGAVIREPLHHAIVETMQRGEQTILLLNRRGYSSFVQCMDCGNVATCPHCSITLTIHRNPERLVCHYCLHKEEPRPDCPRCGGRNLRQRGLGTQQVERLLCERFPSARVARMDVDTTSGKWAHTRILDRVAAGEIDILLGTQMIAKGLDFPNVTLVGVVDADVGINLPDFRASERSFQLLSQVSGRAGRGEKGGRVLIQTRLPNHHAVRYAVSHDYASFVGEEMQGRRDPPYPPNVRLANIVFSGSIEDSTAKLAIHAGEWLRELISTRAGDEVAVIGPAPCPIERIKNRWRWHVLLKSAHPGELTRVSRYFMERFEVPSAAQLRVTLDRDPVALL
ncbi:MAG TPA: primosomal protein N' [Gemmatimonadaceae bacterium]|nr:primosomal protein N' [Gemmatimonadaceae bacterium]